MPGTLILCGTPIGNLGDLSTRMMETLEKADVIFAEDTRRTAKLLNHIGASVPMRSFHAHNERSRMEELVGLLAEGRTVVLVSDAGMPVISDPGKSAVDTAVAAGATITAVPGPSAVVTALALSGFDGDRFVFEGFLPRKGGARREAIQRIDSEQRTVVLFATPTRVVGDLEDLSEQLSPGRRIVVARELTKLHEEVWRGSLIDAVDHWSTVDKIRGEFTLVLEGAPPVQPDIAEAETAARSLIEQGSTKSDAVREIAAATGVSRRQLYDRIVKGP